MFLNNLNSANKKCVALMIATPDHSNDCTGIWNMTDFKLKLNQNHIQNVLTGYTNNNMCETKKNVIMSISGKMMFVKAKRLVKVLAIMNIYNEVDILKDSIMYLLSQGIDVCILDNWSKDGSFEVVKAMQRQYKERIILSKFPEEETGYYEWEKQLINTVNTAMVSGYDWVIHHDADERRESPYHNTTLQEAISYVDELGYNAIDFTCINFSPTEDTQCTDGDNAFQKMIYFDFGKRPGHFLQIKAWKNTTDKHYDLASSGGHQIMFSDRKVFPLKFLLKHYPIRGTEHGRKKVFKDRRERFSEYERTEKGWHTHYDNLVPDQEFCYAKNTLIKFEKEVFEEYYLIERLSGIGIV